jgi:hypothetical protein
MIASPDDPLGDAFPLGDGTADTTALVRCPYCGETNEIQLDPGSGSVQDYVEDCQVCCRPWHVAVEYGPDGAAAVTVEAEDEE